MASFSSRSTLYRTAGRLVILAMLALAGAMGAAAQATRDKAPKGPRALGLLEFRNGKPRLIPIVILIDGEYFDASAYKAAPVPMALWGDTVYEGIKTGVSQGLFTVKSALEKQDTHEWFGEGSWISASEIRNQPARKESPSIPRGINDDEGPPVLRHEGNTKPTAPEPAAASAPPQPAAPSAPSQPPVNVTAPVPAQPPPPDQNIPMLKRGRPAPRPDVPDEPPVPALAAGAKPKNATKTTAVAMPTQIFPAISAATSPEPRSYAYSMKPDEEQQFRKQMLAIAGDEIRARAVLLAGHAIQPAAPAKSSTKRVAARIPPPAFDDVRLRAFDLNSSNEPVIILSAKARLAPAKDDSPQFLVTIVARQDVNADVHKVFSSVTDDSHLDVIPQVELIDAVDVDGDGRGELLFRQNYDSGSAFVVYRVIGNELYPLFQGTPGG